MKLGVLSYIVGLLGFCLVVLGVALIHVPAACIIAGLALLGYAWLMDRAAARMPHVVRTTPPAGEG